METNFLKIPPLFWSDAKAEPFESCIICKKRFIESQNPYLIEKAVRGFNGEILKSTLFEYAVCLMCADQMQEELSLSSRTNITNYFQKHVKLHERRVNLDEKPLSNWLKYCLLKNKELTEIGECQLYALCQGNQLIVKEFPYMISAEAIEEMMDLISSESLKQLENFQNDLLDGPSELRELFKIGGPKVLI